jgi:hypothetical protein
MCVLVDFPVNNFETGTPNQAEGEGIRNPGNPKSCHFSNTTNSSGRLLRQTMPISAEFTWSQTADTIDIQISLKGTPARKVNVYISDVLVKVNFAPYLLQLDLYQSVSFDKSIARFDQRDGKLHLTLPKQTVEQPAGPWKSLVHTFPATASPAEKRKLRQARRTASMVRCSSSLCSWFLKRWPKTPN